MTSVARMPGNASQSWCPSCHGPPGPDCPDKAKTPRQVRRALKRELEGLVMGDDDEGYAAAYAEQCRIDNQEVWPVTKAGTILTPELLASLVAEAEAGYDVNRLVPRRRDEDFFVEDEPVADVLAAFEAGEKVQTEPPAGGRGWCAPSP